MTRSLATLGAASLWLASAVAAPIELQPGMGGVPDPGAISCKTFNAMYAKGQSGTRQATLYWLEGLAYARSGKTLDAFLATVPGGASWTFDTLTGHVVDYCHGHPAASVSVAVEDLWRKVTG